MEKKQTLKAIADILINDVVRQNYNIITFRKLVEILNRKHQLVVTPSEVDDYLEELSLLSFALELPLLNALVVNHDYMPSPRFFSLHRELYRELHEYPRQAHESEVRKIMAVQDWSPLFNRLDAASKPEVSAQTATVTTASTTSETLLSEENYLADLEQKVIAAMENGMLNRRDRLKEAPHRPKKMKVVKTVYDVNPDVIAEVLLRANGFCESCHQMAPFNRKKDNRPYLLVHYKTPLSEGGLDIVDNAIAVCPNCYAKLHDR